MPEMTDSPTGGCKRFECKVIGYPRPSIRWYKDGENITTHRRYKFDYTPDGCIVLIIDKVEPSDQGVYACRAENSEGTAESSALLHVKGGVAIRDDDLTSVHSMTFRLLDSQKRPLVLEQNRQDSSDQSEDSVIDGHPEALNGLNTDLQDITVDTDDNTNADTVNSKWEINGETDNLSDINDDSVNLTVDSNIDNTDDKGKYDELFAEALTDLENSGEPKSRRWTADSGITSRGSSFSSDPDINIDHESVLEMQKYLHGKADAIFEPYDNEKLEETNTEDFERVKTKLISDNNFSDKVIDQQTEFRTKELTEEKDFVDKKNLKNIKMEKGDIAVLSYETYQEDDIGHHFCTSKQNHVDHIETDIDWERVDDHEASVLAGKYLFAHGKDVEADKVIHPLSEWEIIKQADGSQLISADDHDGTTLIGKKIGKLITHSKVESEGTTYVNENEAKSINYEIDEIGSKQSDFERDGIIDNEVKSELVETKKHQAYFSADVQDIKVKETEKEVISTKVTELQTAAETDLKNVTEEFNEVTEKSVLSCLEQNEVTQIETKTNTQTKKSGGYESKVLGEFNDDSTEEYIGSTDDEALYDLDVDRSEQIMQKRSQQYRRSSAQDSLTSEMADQISAKQALSLQNDTVLLESETKNEIYDKSKMNVDTLETDSKNQTVNAKSEIEAESRLEVSSKIVEKIDSADEDLTVSTDDDSYDLDLDRSEQIIAKRTQQIRRPSAQDNLTKEKIDHLSAKQDLIASDEGVALEAETKQIVLKTEASQPDDEFHLDVDRKENALLERRSSLCKQQMQEMDISLKESDNIEQMSPPQPSSLTETDQVRKVLTVPLQEESIECETNEKKGLTDGNALEIKSEMTMETIETLTPFENGVVSKVGIDEHSLESAKEEQKLCEASEENEILDTHEAGLEIIAVDSLSVPAKHKEKKQTIPFEKLSLAEKDAVLKQISDVSLARGRQLRGKAEKDSVDGTTEDEDNVVTDIKSDGENLSSNENVAVISDIKEAGKPLVKIDRQISLTGEAVVKSDQTEAESLHDQGDIDHQTPSVQTVSSPDVLDASSRKKLSEEYRVSELNSDQESKPDSCTNLDVLDSRPIEKAAVNNKDSVSLAKIDNAKEPIKILHQAEETPGDKGLRIPVQKGSLEMLEDTKPAVPNIINFVDDIKPKTEIECKLEEATHTHTAQELKSEIPSGSELVEVDNKDLNGVVAAICEEQSVVITEAIEISAVETTKEGKATISEDEAGKVIDDSETSEIYPQGQITSVSDVDNEQTTTEPAVEAYLESKVDEMEIEQTTQLSTETSLADKLAEKATDLEKSLDEKQQKADAETVGTDVVDADLFMSKRPVTEPDQPELEIIKGKDEGGNEANQRKTVDALSGNKERSESKQNDTTDSVDTTKHALDHADEENDTRQEYAKQEPVKADEKLAEKLTDLEKSLDEKQHKDDAETVCTDVVDVDLSVSKRYLTEPDDSEPEISKGKDEGGKDVSQGKIADSLSGSKERSESKHEDTTDSVDTTKQAFDHADEENDTRQEYVKQEPVKADEKFAEKLTDLEKSLDEKQQKADAETVCTDVVDADLSVSKRNVTEPGDSEPEISKGKDEGGKDVRQGKIADALSGSKERSESKHEATTDSVDTTKQAFDHADEENDTRQEYAKQEPVKTDETQKSETNKIEREAEQITINEGEAIALKWKILDIPLNEIEVIKDDFKVQPDDRLSISCDEDILTLHVESVSLEDEAVYYVKGGNTELQDGAIFVKVTALEGSHKKRDKGIEPAFVLEPVFEKQDGRRMSIKCSVSGFPQPDVTWYRHGQPLGTGEFWDVYSQDGYHFLANSEAGFLDCEEIVCRVENDAGYIQSILQLNKKGEEISCEPVQREAAYTAVDESSTAGPCIELQFTETNDSNLQAYTVTAPHSDKENMTSLSEGEQVELLGTVDTQQWLIRLFEEPSKICYVPTSLLEACVASTDARRQECENVAPDQITEQQINKTNTDLQDLGTEETSSNMPERRKIVPGSKLHGTRDDRNRGESPTDLESKLGFKDDLDKKKDVSDSILSEYEDGTSRPMFKKRLKTIVTRTGELVQMECIVRGSPLPKVLWLKNNRPLKESDNCQVIADEETNMLIFPEVSEDDIGVYTARAMNVNGSVMCSAELSLEDGRPLPFSETAETPMDLDFTTPNYFFQMSSCQVAEGRLARFDCRVVAYPRPEIVWMRDGKVVQAGDRFRLLNMNNEIYSLLIQDVQMSDTGRYTCWARNKFGEAMTEAYLNVIALTEQEEEGDIAPKFLTRFYDQQTTEGMLTDFKCLITGKPEPSVTWLLDDIELKDAPGMRQRHKDSMVSLEIKSPKMEQSGQYTCQLRNPLGEATCSARLTVIEDKLHGKMLPKFLRKFDHLNIKDGEEAKFSCVVVGEPKADIVWMFDHKPIPDSNRRFVAKRDGDTYTLIVKNARMDDTGVITCKAVNDEGEVNCSANLMVREAKYGRETPERVGLKAEQKDSKFGYIPTFTKRLQDVQVSEGASAKFECRVMGIPQPEVTWMKDGRVIPSGGRYKMIQDGDSCYLQINNVSASDAGVYTCIVSNSQGKSSSSAALRLEGLPPKDKYIPEKPMDTYMKKERYTPEKILEDTYTRKTRYTPERFLEDTYAKKTRYTPERFLEDTYGKKRYTPERFFEDYTKRQYTPERYIDDTYAKKARYTPDYLEDTYVKRYTPDRYTLPESYLDQTSLKQPYVPTMKPEAIPKMAFEKPTLLNKTDESVRLSWAPVSTHSLPVDSRRVSYVVESRELPSSVWTKVAYNVPTSSYLVRHLRPDKEYEFRVRAQNQHGVSEPTRSATFEKRVDDSRKFAELPEVRAPPRLPTHRPIITDLGEEMVRLAWRPVETYKSQRIPPVSYQVEAKELPGKDWMPISSRLRDTSHYLSELEADRDYLIRVRAENDFGVSEPTEPLWLPRAKVFPGVPISRPQIVEMEPNKAKLSWSRVDVPAFGLDDVPLTYMLEVEEPPKDWRTLARDLDDTEYIIEGLKPDRDYRFRVRAKTPTGVVSEPSPAVSLYTTLARRLAPVDRLEVLDYEPESKSLHLQWQRVDIPPYSSDEEPLMYMLEYQEPPLPDWRPLVTGIPTTRYRVMHLDPDRDYNFRVRALTPYGVSQPSPALPVTMRQPTAIKHLPEDMTISEVEADSLRLSWRRPMVDLAQPINYQIQMLEPLMADWHPIATGVTDTTYKVTGLKPTRDYKFRVVPYADTRALPSTPVVGLTSSPVRPRLHLSEPKIREMGPESVQLSWQPAELPLYQRSRTPVHYKVEMMELPSASWVPVARRVPDTTYLVSGLKADHDYKFRVMAETDLATSEPSLATVLHRKPAPVFPRAEPTVRDFTPNAVMLSWQPATVPEGISLPVSSPVFYSVEAQSPPGMGGWSTLYARHLTPSVKLSDLRPDLDYLVRVRAHYNDYTSEPTLPVYIPRRAAPPRIPHEEPYAVDIGSDYIKLQWRSADLPVQIMDYAPVTYRIEAQELPGGNWVTVARGVPHTDFKVTGLSPKNDYCFRIRAENDYGISDPTRPVTVGRRAVAPVLPHDEPLMYDLAPGSVQLSWRPATLPSFAAPTTPVTYTIFVQELPYKNWRPHVKRIPQTWYHISGLNPDKEYNFRVQAENEFGTSKPTAAVYMPRLTDLKRPISMPEIDDFNEDLTSVKLHWKPRAGSPFDMDRNKYLIESWEPVKREWYPVAKGIPDTTYQLRGLPAASDRLLRVRLETEQAGLSEPSVPVSVSRFYPMRPVHRPQLYELDTDSVRLSWEPAIVPAGQSRRPVRYVVEMREIPDKTWSKVASDVLDTNYKIRGLRSKYDYEFRVRALIDGETSEPSMPVPLYRRSEIPKVRFDMPEVYDVADDSLSLCWNKVDIPTFSYDDEPLSFMIERQTLPGYQWEPVATNLTGTSYRIQDLKPYQDYAFRVRGVYPSGYTEPSPLVPVYRRPIRLSVPIARPEVWEEEPYSARLRWQPAYIPSYHSLRPKRYRIEMQEAGPTASDWQPVANDVTTPDFTVNELSPRKDYNFRIRAEMENGDISEPTPPIQYYRSQVPMSKGPFTLGEYKPVDYEITLANRTYVDHLTKYVPPRLPIDKPEMVAINPETVELAWKPARVPDSIRHSSNLTYTIEVRNPPNFEWRELVSGLKLLNHTVKKLHPRVDYIFRIRAWNEYGPSEPSLPVSLYRPIQHNPDSSYEDDEAFEKDWELRFGQQGETPLEAVPPKLPMDTPKIITQSPESIWFSWIPARIPAYATQTPITYVIEIKEPPETSWKRAKQGLLDCQYTYDGMNPTRDYHIRVRAETQFGPSEPTLPIIIKRSGSRPGSRRSSLERELMSEEVKVDTTALENLTSGVPPRMSSNRPLSSNVQPTSLTLSWPAGRVPSYVKNQTISYIIEKREPPGHIWTVLAKEIPATRYDIKGLNPDQDYMFRVRARNDFGTSDPTLPMTLYRERDDYVPQKIRSRSGSRDSIQALVSRRRRSSSLLDFDYLRSGSEEVDVCVKDQIPTQPEYTSAPKWDTQYGVEGKKGKIILQVRGYPLPTIHWYLDDEKLDYGDNVTASLSANGTVTLEIKRVRQDSFGTYKCYAENEHGSAVKFVKYEYADPPTVLEPLQDIFIAPHTSGRFTCRVDGVPCPSAKWMKDWHPLKDSTRVKVLHEAPDIWSLEITNALSSDSGLYACTMENIAGKVTMTARLVTEDQEPSPAELELKKSPIEDTYHILEELGRSRQGVIRRVIEKQTGETYAANFIFTRNKAQKNFFMTEFEILRLLNQYDNILKLHDAYETDRSLVLVTELLTGTDLLGKVIADGNWTEAKAADAIKNVLGTLQILGAHNIQHLDIKPSNIYLCGEDSKDLKLINFALSRQLVGDEDLIHNYGSIGYASPEQVAEDIITDKTDIWGVGVLAYILLAGESPFKGTNDFEVLNKTKTCDWEFSDIFAGFSEEAKDFISKLLLKNPSDRLSVEDCLKHPWVTTSSDAKLNNEKLKIFNEADKKKREASKSFTTANLQSFNKILHGASALYQPAMDQDSGEIIFPDTEEYGDFLSEDAWYEWQLHYMDDPDTQNFPLDNKDFTVRESRHTAANDELKRDKKEADTSDIDSAIMFRNKIQTTSFMVGEDVTFTCTVISPNSPAIVSWYRDEQLLGEDAYRTVAKYSEDTGEASLTLTNLKDYDAAIYKCVARNKDGRVSCEARLLLGDVPGKPGRPVVTQSSSSEVFLTWTGPVSNGNSYILGYRTDFKKTDEEKWTRGPFVTDEYALVSGLVPSSEYIFRVSCHNKYGASQYSWASLPVTTGGVDTPKVEIAKYLQPVLQFSSYDKQQLILQAASRRPSLTVAADAKLNEGKPEDSYNVLESIAKGRYGEYKLCSSIASNKHHVMKIMPFTADNKNQMMHEFNLLSSLRQVNIITAYESFVSEDIMYVIFERLSGVNVVQYLCLRKFYSEEIVSRIVRQILDGLQYLQQTGIVHLNLQPSSVVMATRRRLHVKLRDFTLARKLENGQEEKITPTGYPDFIAPEILREEPAGFPADIWGLGALTFVLLSGTSPFGGTDRQETLNRIIFDRYSTSDMYDNVSKEAVSFVTKMLKRLPKNRATVNKCLDSKWLQLSDSMIKSRNSRLFRTETLRDFSELYLERKGDNQYMDMSGVAGESLPKPTVGPITEPVLSKRLPKYHKPISKPNEEAKLDLDSAETIASDFNSILDKIDRLREALDSGSEIPERKTRIRKPLIEENDVSFSRKENIRQDDLIVKVFKQAVQDEVKDLIIPEKTSEAESVDNKMGKPKDFIELTSFEAKTEKVEVKLEKSVEASSSDDKIVEKSSEVQKMEKVESKEVSTDISDNIVKDKEKKKNLDKEKGVQKGASEENKSITKETDSEMTESKLTSKSGKDTEEVDGNALSKSKKTTAKSESTNKEDGKIIKKDLNKKKVKPELKMNDENVKANKSKEKKEPEPSVENVKSENISKQNTDSKTDIPLKPGEQSAKSDTKSEMKSELNEKTATEDNKKTPAIKSNEVKNSERSEGKAADEKSVESDKSKANATATKDKAAPQEATEKPTPGKVTENSIPEAASEKPTPEKAKEKPIPTPEAAIEKPTSEKATEKPTPEKPTEKPMPTPEAAIEKPTSEKASEKPIPEKQTEKLMPTPEAVTEKPTPEKAKEKPMPIPEAAMEKPTPEKPTEKSASEKPTEKPMPTPEAATEKSTPEKATEKPMPATEGATEKPTQEKPTPEKATEKPMPTTEAATEKPTPEKATPEKATEKPMPPTEAATEKPIPEKPTEKPTPEKATPEKATEKPMPTTEAATEKPTPKKATEKPTPEVSKEKPSPEEAIEKPIPKITIEKTTPELATEKPFTEIATEKPTPDATSEKPTPDAASEKSTPKAETKKPTQEVATEKPTPDAEAEKPIPEAVTDKPTPEVAVEKPTPDVMIEKPAPEIATEKPTPEAETEKPAPEAEIEKPSPEAATEKPTPVVATEKPSPEEATEKPTPEAVTEKLTPDAATGKPSPEAATKTSTPDAAVEKPTPEATTERPTPGVATKKPASELAITEVKGKQDSLLSDQLSIEDAGKQATQEVIQDEEKQSAICSESNHAPSTEVRQDIEIKAKTETEKTEVSQNVNQESENNSNVKDSIALDNSETKPEASEIETEVAEDIVKPVAVIKDKCVPDIESLETVVVEEVIEQKVAKKEKALPNLDIKESTMKENETQMESAVKGVSKESIVEEKETVKENESTKEVMDENKLKTNIQKDEVDSDSQIKTESGLGLSASETIKESKVGTEQMTKNEPCITENAVEAASKTDNAESKIENVESKMEDSKPDNEESKTDIVQNKTGDNKKLEQEIDKRINDLADAEKRESVSTVSTESEYLDALSCADNKDMKCHHNHESTPDSQYATPDRDIIKRDSVVEDEDAKSEEQNDKDKIIDKSDTEKSPKSAEINEKAEITEKSDTEAVKENDNSTNLNKEEADNVNEGKDLEANVIDGDGDILDKEKKIYAEAEQIAERVVTEALDDALKVAEC